MIALESTGATSNMERPELEDRLNSAKLHCLQAADGSTLICVNPLLARVRNIRARYHVRAVASQTKGDEI
jgi:hypothetical protein